MIREDDLITQLLEIIDSIDIDTISVSEALKDEIRRYNLFQSQLLKKDSQDIVSLKQINLREYMKYLICNWSKDEKREILAMINTEIILKDKKIIIWERTGKKKKNSNIPENDKTTKSKKWTKKASFSRTKE